MEGLVAQAGRRTVSADSRLGVDLGVGPGLAHVRDRGGGQSDQVPVAVGGGRLGVVDALGDPTGREAVVVDTARVAGREEVVGRAHRGDGGQSGGIGARRRELGEARVADADHSDLVVGHPGLVGHDLDGVVGVVVGRVAEEVERAPRATGSPHLQADRGKAGHPGQHRSHRRWPSRGAGSCCRSPCTWCGGPRRCTPGSGRSDRPRRSRSTRSPSGRDSSPSTSRHRGTGRWQPA